MLVLWAILFLGVVISALKYHFSRRHLYRAAAQYEGPLALPIIGNGLSFYGDNSKILHRLDEMVVTHIGRPFRIWLGPKLIICVTDPFHAEKLFSSTKFAHKHDVYEFLKVVFGEGLVTGSGRIYRNHRRIIQPLFNLQFATLHIDILQKYIDVCMKSLDQHIGGETFSIHHIIHKSVVDMIGETVLGCNVGAQNNKNLEYIQAFIDVYDHGFTRIVKPWLHPDFLYKFTENYKTGLRLQKSINNFIKQAIAESLARRRMFRKHDIDSEPIIDQISRFIEENPGSFSSEDFMYHMATLYAASEDTITIISSFLCVCLGQYPEYQDKAAAEIRTIFGETPRTVTYEDINKLEYLDLCIKDVLRLIPIAPYILRKCLEDYKLDNWVIPKDSAIMLPIYNLHRDPKYWSNPHHFHPDHFLPEVAKNRPVYSYVPFSAGPRGCIGKIFAKIALKTIMCNLLQRYEFEADGKFPDVILKMDLSVRPLDGYNVRLRKRVWK